MNEETPGGTGVLIDIIDSHLPDFLALGFGLTDVKADSSGKLPPSPLIGHLKVLYETDPVAAGQLLYLLDEVRENLISLGANPLAALGMSNPYEGREAK